MTGVLLNRLHRAQNERDRCNLRCGEAQAIGNRPPTKLAGLMPPPRIRFPRCQQPNVSFLGFKRADAPACHRLHARTQGSSSRLGAKAHSLPDGAASSPYRAPVDRRLRVADPPWQGVWVQPPAYRVARTDMACNHFGATKSGGRSSHRMTHAAEIEGLQPLPRQEQPESMNTKGPSASGKSTFASAAKDARRQIGVTWSGVCADQSGHLAQTIDRLRQSWPGLQGRSLIHRRGAPDNRSETRSLFGAKSGARTHVAPADRSVSFR